MANSIGAGGSVPLAFALQNSGAGLGLTYKSDHASYVACANSEFKVMPVIASDLNSMQAVDQYAREVDTSYHSSGLYKMYFAGGGTATMYPRIKSRIGELVYGIVGGVNTTGFQENETGPANLKMTVFEPNDTLTSFPWMTFRRMVTGADGTAKQGDEFVDARITSAVFGIAAGSPMSLRLGVLSRMFNSSPTYSTWDQTAVMTANDEDLDTVPAAIGGIGPVLSQLSGKGLLGDENNIEQSGVSGIQISIANAFSGSQPRNELVVGSQWMDDLALLSQTMSVTVALKWKNSDLYRAIMNGSSVSYTPSLNVLRTGFETYAATPAVTGSYDLPMKLRFKATEVAWSMAPIRMVGGGFLTTTLTGVVIKQALPSDTFAIGLENNVSYTGVTYSTGMTGWSVL